MRISVFEAREVIRRFEEQHKLIKSLLEKPRTIAIEVHQFQRYFYGVDTSRYESEFRCITSDVAKYLREYLEWMEEEGRFLPKKFILEFIWELSEPAKIILVDKDRAGVSESDWRRSEDYVVICENAHGIIEYVEDDCSYNWIRAVTRCKKPYYKIHIKSTVDPNQVDRIIVERLKERHKLSDSDVEFLRKFYSLQKLLEFDRIRKKEEVEVASWHCSASLVHCIEDYDTQGDVEEVEEEWVSTQCGPDIDKKLVKKLRIRNGVVEYKYDCWMGGSISRSYVLYFNY